MWMEGFNTFYLLKELKAIDYSAKIEVKMTLSMFLVFISLFRIFTVWFTLSNLNHMGEEAVLYRKKKGDFNCFWKIF